MNKRLVLAPHVDDEVIGCGGILGQGTAVLYFGVDDFHGVSASDRKLEAAALAKRAGNNFIWSDILDEPFVVNRYRDQFTDLIYFIEGVSQATQPDEVLLPWPSYNQDHQAVYDAAMVALRPHDRNHFVKRVLLYEEPDCFWPGIREPFKPTLFRPIDIDEKIARYSLMPSQVRGHRSPEHIRALAVVRGAAIGVPFAEAYHILRWVE